MAEFIVKDRQTGEVLCKGTRQMCADFLGCDAQYVKSLVRTPPKYEKESKYSKYLVERHGEVKQGGARLRDVICCDCGVLMKNVGASRLRCPDCVIKFNRDRNKQIIREKRNASPVSLNIVNKNKSGCEGCIYFFGDYEISSCCNYIFIMGEPRPCPPGKDCTVRYERSKEK